MEARDIDGIAARLRQKYPDESFERFLRSVRDWEAEQAHHVDQCPFIDLPNSKSSRWGGGVTRDEMREMQWVKPVLVAQVRFVGGPPRVG